MTDVATRPDGDSANADTNEIATTSVIAGASEAAPDVQWAEAPPRKKRHLGAWLGFGIPVGVLAAGAIVASLVLIAPGVTAVGAPVGLSTAGNAGPTIADHLAAQEFEIGGATLTGEQLGLSIDSAKLADEAFGSYPAWNLTAWGTGEVSAPVEIDADKAAEALRTAVPDLYSDSVDAQVVFDPDAKKYTVVEATPGQGVDVQALATSISDALAAGPAAGEPIEVKAQQTEVEAAATTEEAQAFAKGLNDQFAVKADDTKDGPGFYLQDVKALPLSSTEVASWMDISADPESGDFVITPDMKAIEESIKGLPDKVNQDVVNEEVVINSSGDRLRVLKEGQDGFGIGSTDGVADSIAASLTEGQTHFGLKGDVVEYKTTTIFRRAEVDKSAGTTYLYEGPKSGQEKLIASYPIALGKSGHDTQTGHFTVYAQLTSQDMGSCDAEGNYVPGGKYDYCTAHVPWISYFNGDQGFHGTYWHNNFGPGAYMSHGCVNMTEAAAERMYRFLQVGSEVWVHD